MPSILAALAADQVPPPRTPPVPPDAQRVCIDLPGEQVKCHVYMPTLQVMLRKHRDVVFEIALFKGMEYTVEAEQSDFYNARDKKIVEYKKKQKVTFKDGERMHLWVGREFKGHLVLKANGKFLGRYAPAAIDKVNYDSDPSTKPAPMLVVMKNEPAPSAAKVTTLSPERSGTLSQLTVPQLPLGMGSSSSSEAGEIQTMHIVEVNPALGLPPEEVADFFKKGGEDTAIDSNKLMTRNWLWAQITAGTAYVGDNLPWIKDLWRQKFVLTKVKGKTYIVFKGFAGLRKYLTATRYLTDTPKVIAISAGAGSIKGVHKAGWEAVKGGFKGAAKFALVFTIVLDAAEWLADYEDRDPKTGKPKRDLYDLGAKIFTDVTWAALGAVIGVVVMAIATPVLIGIGVSFGGMIAVGAILVAVIAGLGLALIDSKLNITGGIAKQARAVGEYLEKKLTKDYEEYSLSLQQMMQGGAP